MPWPSPVPIQRYGRPDVDPRGWVRTLRPAVVLAIQALAGLVLAVRRPLIVTVTGSHGKTTTREHVAAVLRTQRPDLHVTYRNRNGDIATPLTVLGETRQGGAARSLLKALRGAARGLAPWRPYPSMLVLEVTAKHPGDLERLTRRLRPHVAVLTNVRDAHEGNYPSHEALAGEKCWPLRRLRPGGLAVLNAADPLTPRIAPLLAGRLMTFGSSGDVRAASARSWEGRTTATVEVAGSSFDVDLPLASAHQLDSVLAAVAVGLGFGIAPEDALAACAGVGSLPGRGVVSRSPRGLLVMDETGGATPRSMLVALEALRETLPPPHVAILGGLFELGDAHDEVCRAVGASLVPWLDRLIVVGRSASVIGAGALEAGMPADRIAYARDQDEAAVLARELEPPGSVLLKGVTYLDAAANELATAPRWQSRMRRSIALTD